MKTIKSATIGRLHELAVDAVMKYGKEVVTENNDITIELPEPLCLECPVSIDYRLSDKSSVKESFAEAYMENLIYGYDSEVQFEYDYHSRLFNYNGINQIEKIINHLKEKITTRRAVAVTWQPEVDTEKEDVPCLQWLNVDIRDNKLNMTVLFRSNDILLALGANMYGLTGLQTYIAEKMNVECGIYRHIAVHPHIYVNRDKDELKKFGY